jgi:hypothetical protein
MQVTEASQFIVIAKDTAAEVGRSVVNLQPTQLKVEPATVESLAISTAELNLCRL